MADNSRQSRRKLALEPAKPLPREWYKWDPALSTLMESVLADADCAILERLGGKEVGPVPAFYWTSMTPKQIHTTLASTGIPVVGGPSLSMLCEGGAGRWVSTKGDVRYALSSEYYVFGENGALIRTTTHDSIGRPTNSVPLPIREPGEKRAVTVEEIFGAMAALLHGLAPLWPSLIGAADSQVLRSIEKATRDARNLARGLRQPELAGLRDAGSEALEVFCEAFADRFEKSHKLLRTVRKQPQALTCFMPTAVNCFQLLFGKSATSGSDTAPSTFTKFVAALLREAGCPCDYSLKTIRRSMLRWRAARDKHIALSQH